ncbi:MAG: sensor histidine kinase [Salibacteraceae bacterium]
MRYRSQTQWRGRLLEEREKGIRSLMEAENKVREEVSRDLHDGLGQLLTSVRMQLYGWKSNTGLENGVVSAKEMAKVDQLIGEALGQVRDAAHLMMPRMLEEAGLAAALNELLKYSIDPRQLTCELDAIHTEKRLDRYLEFNLYRVCQELVSNTLKHAQASHFSVQLVYFPKQVQLALEDNGKGFDYASAIGKGAGLNNVKNRVELLGGVLVVEPTLPQGQITKIRIPLNG